LQQDIDYMKKILDVIRCENTHMKITAKTDYPMIIESESFKFYLAPTIINEGNEW